MARSPRCSVAPSPMSARACIARSAGCGRSVVTSPRSPEGGDARGLEALTAALRSAQPRPRPGFLEELDAWMGAELAGCAAATVRPCPSRKARRTIRVVVAEDHPLVREGLIRALDRDPGIEVVGEADNGITAMELAHELDPDVVVLDLRMPGTGGAAIVERLQDELPEVRALVMTANESPESLLDAVAAGAAGYLSKRTTGEELRQAVITTYGGGSVITPELAGHLLREFSGSARGEGSAVRPFSRRRRRAGACDWRAWRRAFGLAAKRARMVTPPREGDSAHGLGSAR